MAGVHLEVFECHASKVFKNDGEKEDVGLEVQIVVLLHRGHPERLPNVLLLADVFEKRVGVLRIRDPGRAWTRRELIFLRKAILSQFSDVHQPLVGKNSLADHFLEFHRGRKMRFGEFELLLIHAPKIRNVRIQGTAHEAKRVAEPELPLLDPFVILRSTQNRTPSYFLSTIQNYVLRNQNVFFLVPCDDADFAFDLSEGLDEEMVVVPREDVKNYRNFLRSSQTDVAGRGCRTSKLPGVVAVVSYGLLAEPFHETEFPTADPAFLRS